MCEPFVDPGPKSGRDSRSQLSQKVEYKHSSRQLPIKTSAPTGPRHSFPVRHPMKGKSGPIFQHMTFRIIERLAPAFSELYDIHPAARTH